MNVSEYLWHVTHHCVRSIVFTIIGYYMYIYMYMYMYMYGGSCTKYLYVYIVHWSGLIVFSFLCHSFIKIYGFHFTKEDHVNLVQFLFQLVIIPNLESPLLNCWSRLLDKLLK